MAFSCTVDFPGLRPLLGLLGLVGLILPGAQAEEKPVKVFEILRAIEPAANTVAIGTRAGFVLEGIPPADPTATPRAGDQVTALVTLGSFEGKAPVRQWLVRLQLAADAPAESDPQKKGEAVYYSNTGEKFTFSSRRTRMQLETLGPIEAATKPDQRFAPKRAEIVAATDFLALDLGRVADLAERVMSGPKTALNLSVSNKPFSAEEIKVQQPLAAARGLVTEDARSFAGCLPALMQFLRIVERTPDLKAILYQVLDKPGVLDVLANPKGGGLNFEALGGGSSGGQQLFWPNGPPQKFHVLPFNLTSFGKPMLTVAFYVTTPHPPLLNSAGIVGLVAWAPQKRDKFLGVRVLSASAGPIIP